MSYLLKSGVRICTLASALLVLPVLVHAQTSTAYSPTVSGRPVPRAPEGNPALVLVPFLGATLLLFSRRLFRDRTARDKS
jgi:hypothetical protein